MRIYEIMAEAHYGNGMAVVIAPTRKRALDLVRAEGGWWKEDAKLNVRCLRGVQTTRKMATVLSISFYQE